MNNVFLLLLAIESFPVFIILEEPSAYFFLSCLFSLLEVFLSDSPFFQTLFSGNFRSLAYYSIMSRVALDRSLFSVDCVWLGFFLFALPFSFSVGLVFMRRSML